MWSPEDIGFLVKRRTGILLLVNILSDGDDPGLRFAHEKHTLSSMFAELPMNVICAQRFTREDKSRRRMHHSASQSRTPAFGTAEVIGFIVPFLILRTRSSAKFVRSYNKNIITLLATHTKKGVRTGESDCLVIFPNLFQSLVFHDLSD